MSPRRTSTPPSARAVAALAELEPDVEPALYRLRDHAAALHLFRVAAGLDSLVPGEGEILGQVRAAHDAGTTGSLLDRVFRQALHAGRKVRAQTAIGESPASVSSAAAALAEQVFGDLDGCSILLVGAGKISEQAARSLLSRAREDRIRRQPHARPRSRSRRALRGRADPARTARGTARDRRRRRLVDERAGLRARRGRPWSARCGHAAAASCCSIDLAVPRDLDPAIHDLDGCYLYDIDDLQAIVSETLVGRRGEAERAEAIVAAEAEKFHEWQASLDVVPAIASLRARAEEIREAELARRRACSDGSTRASAGRSRRSRRRS